MEPLKICAILPAAGLGTRMETKLEKQFYPVLNRPILSYTISAFEKLEEVTSVIVVVAGEKWEEVMRIVEKFEHKKVSVAIGSNSRHKSILEGLKMAESLFSDKLDIIIIHDAVRPLVEREDIIKVASAARIYGVAGISRPLVSTILEVDEDNFLRKSLIRNDHKASETPQAFQYRLLCSAYEKCTQDELEHGTECLQLLQKYAGIRAKLLDGLDNLQKITYKKDLGNIEQQIRNGQWKTPVAIFHEPVDYSLVELFEKSMPLPNTAYSIVSYHQKLEDKLPKETGTFLFVKQIFHISLGVIERFPHCKKDCHKQMQSINFEGSFIENHVYEIFDLIHSLISKKSFIHKRMCLVFLYPDTSTVPLVHATKMISHLIKQNHGDECNVSISSVMFLDEKLTAGEMSLFLKDLHFMNPGTCQFY